MLPCMSGIRNFGRPGFTCCLQRVLFTNCGSGSRRGAYRIAVLFLLASTSDDPDQMQTRSPSPCNARRFSSNASSPPSGSSSSHQTLQLPLLLQWGSSRSRTTTRPMAASPRSRSLSLTPLTKRLPRWRGVRSGLTSSCCGSFQGCYIYICCLKGKVPDDCLWHKWLGTFSQWNPLGGHRASTGSTRPLDKFARRCDGRRRGASGRAFSGAGAATLAPKWVAPRIPARTPRRPPALGLAPGAGRCGRSRQKNPTSEKCCYRSPLIRPLDRRATYLCREELVILWKLVKRRVAPSRSTNGGSLRGEVCAEVCAVEMQRN